MTGDPFMRMTPLELAAGWVPGYERELPSPGDDGPAGKPLAVLESILSTKLRRTPCFIEFSGGRDSSAILAVASQVARREGLPLPIPVTRIFPQAPDAGEDDWPDLVVSHLGLKEWLRIEIRDELDLLGPMATDGLRRHGVVWPVTTHTKGIMFEQARGGALVTGEGGDEVFGPRRITPVTKLLAGVSPRRRGIKSALVAVSAKSVRRRAVERSFRRAIRPWLRPAASEAYFDSVVADALAEPKTWATSILTLPRRRVWTMGKHNLSVAAEDHDTEYFHPLLEEAFLKAFVDEHRILGYPSRTRSMQALFGSVLPAEVLARTTKARFLAPHFHHYSRKFVDRWSGEGVDSELVDLAELKKAWSEDLPHSASLPLMQFAWLASPKSQT